jgi:flagellin
MPTNSINTSSTLFSTLHQINSTNDRFQAGRDQISTGNRFNAKTDASSFSVAQGLRSDLRGYDAVGGAINSSRGAGVAALSASSFTSNLLSAATTNALLALSPSNSSEQSRTYADGFASQLQQIDQITGSANFNGSNLANGSDPNGLNVVSSIDGSQLNISGEDFSTEGLSTDRTNAGLDGLNDIDLADPNTTFGDPADTNNVASVIGDAEQSLALAQGRIASDLRAADAQAEFNTSIQDAVTEGLGSLNDADLARADARDEQDQVQRQFQFQVLAQQNQQRGSILNLFS